MKALTKQLNSTETETDKVRSQNIYKIRLTLRRVELIFLLYFPLRLPSVFCHSIRLSISNLDTDVTPLKFSSRQKAWETDQLVRERREWVLPFTQPTHPITQTLENRQKCVQNGIRERDFSLFCRSFFFATFQTTCSLTSYPSSSLFHACLLFDRST